MMKNDWENDLYQLLIKYSVSFCLLFLMLVMQR